MKFKPGDKVRIKQNGQTTLCTKLYKTGIIEEIFNDQGYMRIKTQSKLLYGYFQDNELELIEE